MKEYRLWINGDGEALYVECLDQRPTREMVDGVWAIIQEALAKKKPILLGPEWEIQVVARQRRDPDEYRNWRESMLVALGAGLTPDPRCDCTVIARPHGLRDHYVPEPDTRRSV